MKRIVVFVATIVSAIALASCDLFTEYITNNNYHYYDVVEATKSSIWNYKSSNPIYEITPEILSVTINNMPSGKTLYLVKQNEGTQNISLNDTRTVVNTSRAAIASDELTGIEADFDTSTLRKHFVGEKLPKVNFSTARSALANPSYETANSVEKSYTAASDSTASKKDIYIDTNADMNVYALKSAHLRAKGTNCYVWVVDEYYTTGTASGNKVNAAIAQDYAEAFDRMYPFITYVFGDESNQIIDYDAQELVDISTKSETGEKINIVVYDLGADYSVKDGKETNGGVVGYFYAKDYYASSKTRTDIIGKSNVGKYFYIDSGYANSNFKDTISTLAHEFQHMVNFNRKEIEQDVSPATWYNEMLSMLCEDMMQKFLNLEDSESPKNRMQGFNAYYYMSGITEYRNDSYAALSYSTAYAFGSWLVRQYGGAELVQEIMNNDSVDNESLVAAVNKVNNQSFSFETLFKQFLLALTGNSTYTHNQKAAQTLSCTKNGETYSYPMDAFNLWSTDELYTLKGTNFETEWNQYVYSGYNWNGPLVFSNENGPSQLRGNNGISIHGIKTTASGSETITFTTKGSDTLKMYLIIK